MAAKTPFHLSDFAQNVVLRGLIGLALLLPYRWRVGAMGRVMAHGVGPLAGYRRRALDNLALVWPDRPAAERLAIATAALDNVGRALIENYSARPFKARMSRVTPTGPGVAVLQAARDAGRAVVLVSGHFGNYEAARACLQARGTEVGALYRPMSNRFFNTHYVQTLQAMGGPNFAKGRPGLAGFMRHLRQGGTMALLFDLHATDGVAIDFLGRPALTALSAADMALRYDAPLIPFYATRAANGLDFEVSLETPIPHGTPRAMTEALTRSLEARILATPGQWFWIHRRWK